MENGLPAEFRPLFNTRLQEDAKDARVIWAKVKGYPWWPAQVLSDSAAHKKLGKPNSKSRAHEPVIFFGTLEIAWVGSPDSIDGFKEGVQAGYLAKSKQPKFIKALTQVSEFLAVDKKRKAPPGWWCRAPNSGQQGAHQSTLDKPSKSDSRARSSSGGRVAGAAQGNGAAAQTDDSSSDADSEPEQDVKAEDSGALKEQSKPTLSRSPSRRSSSDGEGTDGPTQTHDAQSKPKAARKRPQGSDTGAGKAAGDKPEKSRLGPGGGKREGKATGSVTTGSQNADAKAAAQGKQAATDSGSNSQQPTTTSISKPSDGAQPAASKGGESGAELVRPKKKLRTGAGAAAAAAQPSDADMGDAAAAGADGDVAGGDAAAILGEAGVKPETAAPAAEAPVAEPPAPAPAPALPREPSNSAYLFADDDVFKLPAEIRRLAGIKLVKHKPQAAGQDGQGAAPKPKPAPAAPKADADTVLESPKATDGSLNPRFSDSFTEWTIGRRETRAATTPRGNKAQQNAPAAGAAAEAPKASAATAAAPAAADAPAESVAVSATSPKGPVAEPAGAAAAAKKEKAAKAAAPAAAAAAAEQDAERQRRLDRELQLQRKRERERERRQQLRLQKQAQDAAAAATTGAASQDGSEPAEAAAVDTAADTAAASEGAPEQNGDAAAAAAPQATSQGGEGTAAQPESRMSLREQREMRRLQLGDDLSELGPRRERRESPTVLGNGPAASDAAAPAMERQGSQAVGRPPRPATTGSGSTRSMGGREMGKGGKSANLKSRSTAVSKTAAEASGVEAGSPTALQRGVSLAASRKSSGALPAAVLGSDAAAAAAAFAPPVIMQTLPARRSAPLSKRNSGDTQATISDAPASSGEQAGRAASSGAVDDGEAGGPTEEELQDAEAAEALQFMQSMGTMERAPAADSVLPIQLPSPVLSQLEAMLGQVTTVPAAVPAAAARPAAPAQPQPYRVPRRRRTEVSGFQWPREEPALPAGHDHFYLPRDWLMARPPKYEPIKRNVWVSASRPKRHRKDEVHVCQCKPPSQPVAEGMPPMCCGDNCLNRSSLLHCDPKYCPCGEYCSNKPFHLLRQPRVEAYLTENRGYGVRALQRIKAGQFILEYVGEVIDSKELSRRMEAARSTAQHSYYIMELEGNSDHLYIDARTKGGIARLINSSCNPNCETQKWHDASSGEPRVGIFARRDIEPGEELTYDYFFEQYSQNGIFNSAFFKCMCGAPNCRGTMDNQMQANRRNKDYGKRIDVFWDADGIYYRGTVVGYNPNTRRHVILYDDGDQEKIDLQEVAHKWVEDGSPGKGSGLGSGMGSPVGLVVQQTVNAGPMSPLFKYNSAGTADGAGARGGALWAHGAMDTDDTADEVAAAAALQGRRAGGRSIMAGLSTAAAPPPKKRVRATGVLPPLRTYANDARNSGTAAYGHHLSHAASAPAAIGGRNGAYPAEPRAYGGDMESLLQAVEVELGDREAAAAAEASGQQHGVFSAPAWPASSGRTDMDIDSHRQGGRGPVNHQRSSHLHQPGHHSRSPRHVVHHVIHHPPGHAQQQAAVRSPHKRGAAGQARGGWAPPQQQGMANGQPHRHHVQQVQQPGMRPLPLPGQQVVLGKRGQPEPPAHPLAAALVAPGANGHTAPTTKQALIEEVLGIRISTFTVPLFKPTNGQHKHITSSLKNGLVQAVVVANGVANGLPNGTPRTVVSGDQAPHMQRMPITTQMPVAPGTSGAGASGSRGASPAAAAPAAPAVGPNGAVRGTASGILSALCASPLLADMGTLQAKLRPVDLFQRGSQTAASSNTSGAGGPVVVATPSVHGNGVLPHAALHQLAPTSAAGSIFVPPRAIVTHTAA